MYDNVSGICNMYLEVYFDQYIALLNHKKKMKGGCNLIYSICLLIYFIYLICFFILFTFFLKHIIMKAAS